MANVDGQPDHAAPELVTDGLSPKTLAAGLWALLLSVGVPALAAILEYATSNPELFAALPRWVQVGLMAAIVAAGTALAAWRARPGAVTSPGSSQGD